MTYFQLRDYGVDGQIGLEQTPSEFIATLVGVFAEVRRVLRPDGVCFVNIGDSYAGSGKGPQGNGLKESYWTKPETEKLAGAKTFDGIKAKDLMLIPQRFAIAMQDNGWWVRSQIAWCLSGGTQVYVRSQKGDMSMSVKDMARLKPETLQLWNGERWTRVLRMWESTDDGDPLEIELRSGERIGCTPNHLWPTERGLLHAKNLVVGDRLRRVRLPEPDLPRKPIALDDEDIGWFVGLYLAEGCMSTNYVSIAGHVKEVERFERVQRIAQAFDGTATVREAGGYGATISVYGRILRAIIEEYIAGKGAHGKHLTNACWRRSDVFLRGLLDGYLHGDGHWDEKNQRWRLGFARNYEWAADLRTLCARLGVSLRLRPRFATMNGRSFPTFRGEIRFSRSGGPYDKSDDEIVAIGHSKGRKFWDIEVEDEPHTFALASGILTHNCKTSAMPESVRDRPTSAWEPIWMFTKSAKYFWDQDAVRQPLLAPQALIRTSVNGQGNGQLANGSRFGSDPIAGANLRNVWLLSPEPSREEHYAAFPTEIPKRCILAATSQRGQCPQCGAPWVRVVERTAERFNDKEGAAQALRCAGVISGGTNRVTLGVTEGVRRETKNWQPSCQCDAGEPVPQTVLDPFAGSGTTLMVADRLGRNAVGCELNPEYVAMMKRRITNDAPMFAEVEVAS